MSKVAAIQEAIDLIDEILADVYIEQAEASLGINFLGYNRSKRRTKGC
jgi:hypothetical protein